MILDLSLAYATLYARLRIENLAGKPTLHDPPDQSITRMAENRSYMEIDQDEVVLTGSMAIWAHLAAFHLLHYY